MRNIVLTGIPRGGTTLAAALIDTTPDCVCLSEPSICLELQSKCGDAKEFASKMSDLFSEVRDTLLSGGVVMDRRSREGKPITNYFTTADGNADRTVTYIEMPRSLSAPSTNLTLGMKHNGLFSSAVAELNREPKLDVYCIVRNPIPVLKSWESLNLPVRDGLLPSAEKYWPEIAQTYLAAEDDRLQRQLNLYLALIQRYVLLGASIVKYEDIVADPAQFVADVTGYTGANDYSHVRQKPYAEDDFSNAIRTKLHARSKNEEVQSLFHLYPELQERH